MSVREKISAIPSQVGKINKLTLPYFNSEEKWKARLLLLSIVTLTLLGVYVNVLFNNWNRRFYDALQNRQSAVYWHELLIFTYIAFASIIIGVYRFYLTQLLNLRWRTWLTRHMMQRWLSNQAFYRMELARFSAAQGENPDNPDQRMQEDLKLFTAYSMSLSMGLLNAVVTLVSFVGILWGLSGSFGFDLAGNHVTIPGFMVWAALLYAMAGSVITHWIGKPIIGLSFNQQRYEADYRHHLVRVREYAEPIALDRGEQVEQGRLNLRFDTVIGNFLALLKAQKRLIWFTSGFSQLAIIFPFVVAAPRFFSGALQLGDLMQIASAFGQVSDSLSWLVNNYGGADGVAGWLATTNRLTRFEDALQRSEAPNQHVASVTPGAELQSDNLSLQLPDGTHLLDQASMQIAAGDSVVISGASGSGKSTLFRAWAGIWPWASGQVTVPSNAMFVPQRAYFPQGSLREALAYPDKADHYSDAQLREALAQAELPQLATRLDEQQAWDATLSGGEQQRLALARVLLKKPQWVFADEATSALDPAAESTLYERLKLLTQQQKGALVSIAHRPSVAAFHQHHWTFEPQAGGGARYQLKQT